MYDIATRSWPVLNCPASTCEAPTPSTRAVPTAVIRLTVSENRVWRRVRRTRAPTVLAAEGDDHLHHRDRLVDDRQRLALHLPDLEQPGLDVLHVVADRVVQERH